MAARYKHEDIAMLLIKNDADLFAVDNVSMNGFGLSLLDSI
jgi:hypothetical protein